MILWLFNKIDPGNRRTDLARLEKSVAVLPFKNDSPDQDNSYFIDGLMEEVLNNLQRIKDLRVSSRTSVEQYRNQTKSIPEIARELGVNYIIEGSGQVIVPCYCLNLSGFYKFNLRTTLSITLSRSDSIHYRN